MCGIFCYLSQKTTTQNKGFLKLKNRGPDDTKYQIIKPGLAFGFHRLSINDISAKAMQPMTIDGVTVICNGEIYNYKELAKLYGLPLTTTCDCEIIPRLYAHLDGNIEEMLRMLDGVFAMILYDEHLDELYVARDPFGVRPLFMGVHEDYVVYASEAKALTDYDIQVVTQFKPSFVHSFDNNYMFQSRRYYYAYDEAIASPKTSLYDSLTKAVEKRLMSDRPIAFLLSGGLDSSLIVGIAAKLSNRPIHTFSIGLPNAPDLKYARIMSEYAGSIHHEVVVTEEEFLDAIPEVIETIESYDVTTVRASVGNYLIGKYIKKNTNFTVVYNGDGSDEMGGYKYFKYAPNKQEFDKECWNLLENIHFFDVLRSDRCMSSKWGLETRTPFLDKDFVSNYMSQDRGIDKSTLRNAFKNKNIVPEEILWRPKEAFSDGCSSEERSWHEILQEKFENEEEYYKKLFDKYYPGYRDLIPYKWMPKWVSATDPSARELK